MISTHLHAHPHRQPLGPPHSDRADIRRSSGSVRAGRVLLAACTLVGFTACGGATDASPEATPEPTSEVTSEITETDVIESETLPAGDTRPEPANERAAEPATSNPGSEVADPSFTDASSQPSDATDPTDPAEPGDRAEPTDLGDPADGGDEPVTPATAAIVESTPALEAFADTHGELVTEWSATLTAFGDEAIDHIDDVSTAPSAAAAAELSDELATAIGDAPNDDVLVTLKSFAQGVSTAIGFAVDGDQESALSVFLGLQTQSDTLTAILDHFEA